MYLGEYLQPASGAPWPCGRVPPALEGCVLTPPLALVPGADITVLEACPRTIPVLPFKGIFANVGSLASWTRLRVSKAGSLGRGERLMQCPGDHRSERPFQFSWNFPFPAQPCVLRASSTPHTHARDGLVSGVGLGCAGPGRGGWSFTQIPHRGTDAPTSPTCSPLFLPEPCGPRQGACPPHEPVWWEAHDHLQGWHLPRGRADGPRQHPSLPGPGQQLWSHPSC